MKTVLSILCTFALLGGIAALSLKSAQNRGPDAQQVQGMFRQYFAQNLPIKWAGSVMGGKLQNIDITNVQVGESLKKQNGGRLPENYAASSKDCWPVSMHVKGAALANMLFGTEYHEFEDDASFMICKSYQEDSWSVSSDKIMMSSR